VARLVSGRAIWIVIGTVVLVLLGYALFVRGGGEAPAWLDFLSPDAANPLESSGAPEQVLRSMRLMGVDRALAGEQRGEALVRVELPVVNSAPDVEIAWQAGIAALATAYPSAREYVVQVFLGATPLVEVRVSGAGGRAAAEGADLADQSVRFIYLSPGDEALDTAPSTEPTPGVIGYMIRGLTNDPWHEPLPMPPAYAARAQALADARPDGAGTLPASAVSVGLDLPPAYLDAKNRAAGFISDDNSFAGAAAELPDAAERARAAAPGIPALPAGTDAAQFWSDQVTQMLGAFEDRGEHADDLARSVLEAQATPQDPQGVGRVRAIAMTVMAVESGGFAENTSSFARLSEEVRDVPLPSGPDADAVLTAAYSPQAPLDAKEVERFERVASLDRDSGAPADTADAPTDTADARRLDWGSASVEYAGPGGSVSITPEQWLGYRRADGAEYLLAGTSGPVAVTDASIIGWAFELPVAAVVDSSDVGIVRAYLDLAR